MNSLIGKRVLVKAGFYNDEVEEFKIIELSPSLKYVKVMNIHGRRFWKKVNEVVLIEVLAKKENPPKESEG